MPRCAGCGQRFTQTRNLTAHQPKCAAAQRQSKETYENAQKSLALANIEEPRQKRARTNGGDRSSEFTDERQPAASNGLSGVVSEAVNQSNNEAGPSFVTEPSVLPSVTTRSGRQVRSTWKVRDQVPEVPGAVEDTANDALGTIISEPEPSTESHVRRVRLLVTERIMTAANRFHLSRLYKRRPVQQPDPSIDLHAVYTPTAAQRTKSRSKRTIADIIAPYPNLSSFFYGRHWWLSGENKSIKDSKELQEILTRKDFSNTDLAELNIDKVNDQLAVSDIDASWVCTGEGWKESSVTIGLPSGQKSTQHSRKAAAADQRRLGRTEDINDLPAEVPIAGEPIAIPGLWHKDLCAEIKNTFETDPAAQRFIFDPYLLYYSRPGSNAAPEPVYSETFNSPVLVEEDIRLQNSPPEPGCDLPRAIVPLMFWSDATHVAQFGKSKVWPAYLYFGNQSKYERARATCHAAHHVALFPTLPDDIQDRIRQIWGKSGSMPLLTHLRRELFHASWHLLIDDKFVDAYRHGMVVDCADGIQRRLYPRLFTYSADYPEKMLIATLRDKGKHPCPRCLVTFDEIPDLGTQEDCQLRKDRARRDTPERRELIARGRSLIYDEGYVVNSEKVDCLLKDTSAVPTVNTFSKQLSSFGFDFHRMLVPDILHEFELGIWKAVFSQLIRMVNSVRADLVHELDRRYRLVPTFGPTTIRRFARSPSAMSNIAARDFEDLLQCAIPCFEGLFPSPDNEHVMSLLYILAYWHALAKMRLHIESSVKLLDETCTAMGTHLRHFKHIVCNRYLTKETEREYDARIRAQSRAASSTTTMMTTTAGRKFRTFNISVIKLHLLGDYADYIRHFGTLEALSTIIGENQHCRLKSKCGRTNNREREGQVAKINVRETRLRRMTAELAACGVTIPGHATSSTSSLPEAGPEVHHWIAQESDGRNAIDLRDLYRKHPGDPALEDFTHTLHEHIRERLWAEVEQDPSHPLAHRGSVWIKDNRIYSHATLRVNFTTYDVHRDQDVIHCPSVDNLSGFLSDKSAILVSGQAGTSSFPWLYAVVLRVFHANVVMADSSVRRLEFLWVCWLNRDPDTASGPAARRLERVCLCDLDDSNAVSFIDPATVIRGCHIIPAFCYGLQPIAGPSSVARSLDGDWNFYYINHFVDRDMMMRHTGMSIGSLELQSRKRETVRNDQSLVRELVDATTAKGVEISNEGVDVATGEWEEEPDYEEDDRLSIDDLDVTDSEDS